MRQRQAFLDFALELALVAEAQILPHYQNCVISAKPDGTEVTEADRQAEQAIRQLIGQRFPNHGIMGEEYGLQAPNKTRYQWVVDPLDGTAWFALGTPMFGTLIALLEGCEPLLGVIHFPVLKETVYAAKGFGCWFKAHGAEPKRVRVNAVASLKDAVVSASGAHSSDVLSSEGEVAYRLSTLMNRAGKFRFCTDCLQYALLCRGRVHVGMDPIMNPWDSAAIVPCVEEAGGVITTLSGDRDDVVFGGSLLASCNPTLHEAALRALQP